MIASATIGSRRSLDLARTLNLNEQAVAMSSNELEAGSTADSAPGNGGLPADPEGRTPAGVTEDLTAVTSDTAGLVTHSDSDELSTDEDSEDESTWPVRRRPSARYQRTKWWFQEPAVKRNRWVVIGTWLFIFLGIACFIAGIVLEVLYHAASLDVVRGFIFILIAAIVLIPSVYAVTHVYLAARRVGRIRFSSVWFFRH